MNPLESFYRHNGEALPSIREVAGDDVPEPYRRLLVHERDMTSVLETFVGQRLSLRVIRTSDEGETLSREVVLVGEDDGKPAEFGAIRIYVEQIHDADARQEIRQARWPLGGILRQNGIEHHCRPRAFFEVPSDRIMRESLAMSEDRPLYGRHNLLYGAGEVLLAEVVEILPVLA